MSNQNLSKESDKFRFALGLMTGVVLTLVLTWALSGTSIAEESPRPIKETTNVTETPAKPKKEENQSVNRKPGKEDPIVILTANKMQVFYIGVRNPISVSSPGNIAENISLTCSGCEMVKQGGKEYNVTVRRPGEVMMNASVNDNEPTTFKFRAKRLPDPVARLSKSTGGVMGVGEFTASGGLGAFLDNFDFEAVCRVQGFELTRIPKKQDEEKSTNPGARYNPQSKELINRARPGDTYHFTNVKARCPGDAAGRKINTLIFQIK